MLATRLAVKKQEGLHAFILEQDELSTKAGFKT